MSMRADVVLDLLEKNELPTPQVQFRLVRADLFDGLQGKWIIQDDNAAGPEGGVLLKYAAEIYIKRDRLQVSVGAILLTLEGAVLLTPCSSTCVG